MNQIAAVEQASLSSVMPDEFREIASILQLDAQLLGDYSVKAVNGRQLQLGLGFSKRNHTTWAMEQVAKCDLEMGKDYEILSLRKFVSSNSPNAREQEEKTFCFTVPAAKEISMSAKDRGKLVRRYFLHMEKVAQDAYRGQLPTLPNSPNAVDAALDQATRYSQYLKAAMGDAWSQGYHQKVTHEQFQAAGRHYGVNIEHMLPAPTVMLPGQAEEIDKTKGVHFMEKAVGAHEFTPEEIKELTAGQYRGVSFNDIMESLGYIRKLWAPKKRKYSRQGLSGVQLTAKADPKWASTVKFGKSTAYPGQDYVKLWHWNAFTDTLRTDIVAAAKKLSGNQQKQ